MKTKKRLIIILSIVVALILALIIGVNAYFNSLMSKMEQGEEIKEEQAEIHIEIKEPEAHEVVNFMLVGADNLQREIGRENSYVEERSDVLKVVSLDYTSKKIKLTSVDRDIIIWIPGNRQELGRFNWAYSFGGPTLGIQALNYNLDLDVTQYVTFSFAGFINVIDKIGGIDVELTENEAYYFNNNTEGANLSYIAYAGINHLNGHDALTYARLRHLDSDFVRMERQNVVIKAVIDKMKDLDILELLDIVDDCLPYINTNLTTKEIRSYLTDILSFDLGNIETHTYPTDGINDIARNYNGIGGYVLNSYSDQVTDLHKFIYEIDNYVPSSELKEAEKIIYDTYGDYYENSNLIP